jgi:hypothetical protein
MDAKPAVVEVGRALVDVNLVRVARSRRNALARANERTIDEMIRRWQALPPERRTHFQRKRIGLGRGVSWRLLPRPPARSANQSGVTT